MAQQQSPRWLSAKCPKLSSSQNHQASVTGVDRSMCSQPAVRSHLIFEASSATGCQKWTRSVKSECQLQKRFLYIVQLELCICQNLSASRCRICSRNGLKLFTYRAALRTTRIINHKTYIKSSQVVSCLRSTFNAWFVDAGPTARIIALPLCWILALMSSAKPQCHWVQILVKGLHP